MTETTPNDEPRLRLAAALRALATAVRDWHVRAIEKREVYEPLTQAAQALEDMANAES